MTTTTHERWDYAELLREFSATEVHAITMGNITPEQVRNRHKAADAYRATMARERKQNRELRDRLIASKLACVITEFLNEQDFDPIRRKGAFAEAAFVQGLAKAITDDPDLNQYLHPPEPDPALMAFLEAPDRKVK